MGRGLVVVHVDRLGADSLEQFVCANRECGLDTSAVIGAHEIHPILSRLCDRLLGPTE